MRGLLIGEISGERYVGITPAHAGLTEHPAYIRLVLGDHPRACGAYDGHSKSYIYTQGSPPRMRGLRTPCLHCISDTGITPAHAGLTPDEEMLDVMD